MKQGLWLLPLIFALFLPKAYAQEHGEQLVDRVAAVVNKEVITQSEVDVIFYPVYEQMKKAFEGRADFDRELQKARLRLINQLVEDKLVYQEAERLGVEVDEKEIDEEMDRFKSQFKKPEEFDQEMKRSGMTSEEFRQRIKERLAIMKLHQYEIHSKITILPSEIEEYFKAHQKEFVQKEQIKLWGITIRKNEDAITKGTTDEAAKKKAEDILSRLKKGENFETIAEKESQDQAASQGGLVGMVSKGDMIENIDKVIFSLSANSLSGILETEEGYHIFKVGEKKTSSEKTFEQAKDQIREIIFRQKAHDRFVSWMDDLKKKAYISIR